MNKIRLFPPGVVDPCVCDREPTSLSESLEQFECLKRHHPDRLPRSEPGSFNPVFFGGFTGAGDPGGGDAGCS